MDEKTEIKFEFTQEDIDKIVAPIRSAPVGGYSSVQKNKEIYTKAFTLFVAALDKRLGSTISAITERVEGAEIVQQQSVEDVKAEAEKAVDAKDKAQRSENIASSAASAALNRAEDAEDAKNAAVEAKDEAVNAKTAANEAKNAAVEARFNAEASERDAQLAQSMAETAQREAESAKDTAVTAKNSAINSQVQAAMFAKTAQDAADYVSTTVRDVARAKSFDNYSELVNHLQTAVLDIPYAEGQPFYIIETDVPDLWVSGVSETNHLYSFSTTTQFLKDLDNKGGKLWVGNYQLSKLETAKVYLGDLQKQTDNRLQTSSKDVVTAINEVRQTANTASSKATAIEKAKGKSGGYASLNASGQVPSEQLPDLNYQRPTDERLTTDSKEIYGAINELDGRLDNIGEVIEEKVEPLVEDVGAIEQALQQAKVQAPYWSIESYNSRVTAGGKNVLNGSKAVLHKVVGDSKESKNLLRYGEGISNFSTYHENGGVTFTLRDDGGVYVKGTYVGDKNSATYDIMYKKFGGTQFVDLLEGNEFIVKEGICYSKTGSAANMVQIQHSENSGWTAICVPKGYTVDGVVYPMVNYGETPLPFEKPFDGIKSVSFGGIKSTNANGEESVITFPKTELPSGTEIDFDRQVIVNADGTETPFTEEMKEAGNDYTVWANGTETVLENDGAAVGANPTLTQSYTVVNEIGSGGGSSGGSSSGGITQSAVQVIAEQKANVALASAKTYADGKATDAVSTANAYTDGKVAELNAIIGGLNSDLEEILGE